MTATASLPRGSVTPEVVLDRDREAPVGATGEILQIPLELIDIDENVRKNVVGIEELAASIAEHGVRQPISVRDVAGARYAINFGQRRYLASELAGRPTIPAFVDNEARTAEQLAIHQLVENLSREDLPPLDRARAMRVVVDAGMTQAELARQLGLAASTVTNDLGLLEAPATVQTMVANGELTPAHAKAMKGLAPKTQVELARDVARFGYSAHRTEEMVQDRKRQAEREAQDAKASAARLQQERAGIEERIKELAAAKKPGLDTEIVVFHDYQGDAKASMLAELLKAAGFTKVRIASGSSTPQTRPTGGLCTCSAWKATLTSSYSYSNGDYTTKLQATPACLVDAHRQAKATADRKAETAKWDLQQRTVAHVKAAAFAVAIPPTSADAPLLIGMPRILAESALWGLLGYRLPDWSVAHGGKRNTAWAVIHGLSGEELATELAKELANDFRDKAGYHIDWPALAEELDLVGKPEEPVTPPIDTRVQPAFGDKVVSDDGSGIVYRIQKLPVAGGKAAQLAIAVPQWRNGKVVAVANVDALTYDKPVGVWRGPTVPAEQAEAVPA